MKKWHDDKKLWNFVKQYMWFSGDWKPELPAGWGWRPKMRSEMSFSGGTK